MDMNCENIFKILVYIVAGYVTLKILQDNCGIQIFEGFDSLDPLINTQNTGGILASEGVLQDSGPLPVQGLGRTPSSCYPQPTLTAQDLLPKEDSAAINEFNIAKPAGEGILQGVNMLDAGFHVGVNSIGQSLKNANRQLRAEPPNPQVAVSPWMMSSIGPDLMRRPLEDGEGCAGGIASGMGPVGGGGGGGGGAPLTV